MFEKKRSEKEAEELEGAECGFQVWPFVPLSLALGWLFSPKESPACSTKVQGWGNGPTWEGQIFWRRTLSGHVLQGREPPTRRRSFTNSLSHDGNCYCYHCEKLWEVKLRQWGKQHRKSWNGVFFPDNRATREGKTQTLAVLYNINLMKSLMIFKFSICLILEEQKLQKNEIV